MDYTKEKSRVDATQAILFRQLREHYQKRDRLRLIVDYRKKYLDSLVRGGDEEAKQTEANYEQANWVARRDPPVPVGDSPTEMEGRLTTAAARFL